MAFGWLGAIRDAMVRRAVAAARGFDSRRSRGEDVVFSAKPPARRAKTGRPEPPGVRESVKGQPLAERGDQLPSRCSGFEKFAAPGVT